jgi:hypothetical protein
MARLAVEGCGGLWRRGICRAGATGGPHLAKARAKVLYPEIRHPHHVWERRFYDFNVWTERKRIEKLRYIHRNPVKRGLVEEPEQWRWSSFRSYAVAEVGVVRVNEWEVMKIKVRAVGSEL